MRIHSNTLRASDARDALIAEKKAGRIAAAVSFKILTEHRSQSHAHAFEIQLDSWAKEDGDGRRAGNTGGYGGDTSGMYAATYDEWGWLLAALYAIDPHMVCGTVKYPAYADREDFDWKTGLTYNPAVLLSYLGAGDDDSWDPYPFIQGRSKVGRHGANRVHVDAPNRVIEYCDFKPRTAAAYRTFARLETAAI